MSTLALNSTALTTTQHGPATAVPLKGKARTRLRLTRRGRAVLTSLAALPLVVGAFSFALNGGGAAAGGDGPGTAFAYITVEAGQSLWQLAEELAPAADPRDVISDIVSLNQLTTTDIEPGQLLAVPARY